MKTSKLFLLLLLLLLCSLFSACAEAGPQLNLPPQALPAAAATAPASTPTPTLAPKVKASESSQQTLTFPQATSTPTQVPTETPDQQFSTLCDVNLRSGPGTNYDVVTVLAAKTLVQKAGPLLQGWQEVQTGRFRGYIRQDLIQSLDAGQAYQIQRLLETAPAQGVSNWQETAIPENNAVYAETQPQYAAQEGMPAEDDNRTVYRTKTGTKYHEAGCKHLSRSCIPLTLGEAKARNLGACKDCH